MQVRELIELLSHMSQDDCVMLQTRNNSAVASSILRVAQHGIGHVVVCDFYVDIQPKTIRAFDGKEYDIPWGV